MASSIHRTVDAIWRMEAAKITAVLTRIVRDVGIAEDLAQDTLIVALEKWPETGIPDNPAAWLMTAAKRRALDYLRRDRVLGRKYEEIGREMDMRQQDQDYEAAVVEDVGDDLLRLIFMTCHPLLSSQARVALTLRLLGGLTTVEIAHAYLVPEPTVAQRIVRAKRTLAEARVPFEVPQAPELKGRLSSVYEVIYLMFNEGYSATSGENWTRPLLCKEALRLGRILAEIVPSESEVHGLVALMEFQSSRLSTRVDSSGEPILLMDQNRAKWDQLLIRRGFAALERAGRIPGALGPYSLQASISACHARARTPSETNWIRIAALYEALAQAAPSPVVELNRAVSLAMAFGPEVGLEIVDALALEPALKEYHLLPSVRGDFLMKLGRVQEACEEFKRAASLTSNARERAMLLKRASDCVTDSGPESES